MVAKMLLRPEGGLSCWWGSWQGSPTRPCCTNTLHAWPFLIAAPERWEPPRIHPSTMAGVSAQGWALPLLSPLPKPAWGDLLPPRMERATPSLPGLKGR